MGTIQKIGIEDLERLLAAWEPGRTVNAVHLRHTRRPRRLDFLGESTLLAMRRHHIEHLGLVDIAQHLTIDPDGGLWTGRDLELPPASAGGRNGDLRAGPVLVMLVGDFAGADAETLSNAQRRTAEAVVAALLRRFGLKASAIAFQGDLAEGAQPRKTGKRDKGDRRDASAPGLDLEDFRATLEALVEGDAPRVPPKRSDAVLDAATVRSWADAARGARALPEGFDESPFAEPQESDWALARQALLAEQIDGSRAGARDAGDGLRMLQPYVVNLSKGLLSGEGHFSTAEDDTPELPSNRSSLRRIVEQDLPAYIAMRKRQGKPAHIMFYAHGGLVSEKGALCYAKTILPWWRDNGVYPIFFVWQSSVLDALRNKPRGLIGKLVDKLTDATDFLAEGISQPIARDVWRKIKRDAENASSAHIEQYGSPGGAYLLAEMLRPLLLREKAHVRLHAVGHSTGPILLAPFMRLLSSKAGQVGAQGAQPEFVFDTLSYLAPAIRTDRFEEDVVPEIGDATTRSIREFTMYTMTERAERDDNVIRLYRKSLLYFVREACEDLDHGRVLGLAADLVDDETLAARFGIPGKPKAQTYRKDAFTVHFSPQKAQPGEESRTSAIHHGDFDNDVDTMTDVLERILASSGAQPLESRVAAFPTKAQFESCRLDSRDFDGAADGRRAGARGDRECCCRCRDDDADNGDDGEDPPAGEAPAPSSAGRAGDSRAGRRLALCIGIDHYPDAPLGGCVNDSRRWADAFKGLGFQVKRIIDREATRGAILQGLRELIASARAGDELVFQYAGHGTQIDDDSGDEADRLDEAFVPIDYADGALLLDDDFYRETERLARGAHLTLFMDCCHSGSNSRVAPIPRARGGGERVRFMRLGPEAQAKYRDARRRMAIRRGVRERLALPGVIHFAACRDHEFAWESGGQGDFTRIATAMLARAAREGASNQAFVDAVIAKFGAKPRQHPWLLSPAAGLGARRLLGG